MSHEPGIPAYLRGPSRGLISLAVIVFGCAMAYLGAMQGWSPAVVLTFGVVITALAFFKMEWAILGLVVISNFDGFLKPLLADQLTLVLKDYFIFLAAARWLWGLLCKEERPSIRTMVAAPALLFAGYVVAELANPNSLGLVWGLAGVRAWLLWIPVFFITYDTLQSRRDLERLWMVATVVSLITGAYGIVQYFIGFEHLYRLSSHFEYYARMGYVTAPHGELVTRVFSTMVHPGVFGSAMGFMALVAGGLILSVRSAAWRVTSLVCLPVITIALFLSGTRAAMIGATLGLLLFIVLSKRPALLLVAGTVLLGAFWQSFHLTGGALESRVQSITWEYTSERSFGPLQHGLEVALKHPFGRGVSSGTGVPRLELTKRPRTKAEKEDLFIENDFGRAMAELGVGALLYVLLLGAVGVGSVMACLRLRSASNRTLAAALLGGVLSIGITLSIGSSLYVAPGALYFWLGVASVMRLPDLESRENEAAAMDAPASAA